MTYGIQTQAKADTTARRRWQLAGSALGLTLVLSGCGGGSSDSGTGGAAAGPAAAASVPDSAYQSTPAFMQFIASLRPDDRAEPLLVGDQTPPTDNRAEPWDGVQ